MRARIGAPAIQLFRKVSDPSKGESYQTVGSWPWPTTPVMSEVWLILQPQKSGEYRRLVLSDDLNAFPRQSVRIINFATQKLGAKIKEQSFLLEPFTVRVVPAPTDNRKRVETMLALPSTSGVWELLPHPLIMYNENYRSNLMVTDRATAARYLMDYRPVSLVPLTAPDPGADVLSLERPAP